MKLNKWNYKTREYEPYNSPAIKPVLYSEDMDLMADCANCGKELKYGDMYTSRTIHTELGLGYGVCEKCYEQEFANEKKVQTIQVHDEEDFDSTKLVNF